MIPALTRLLTNAWEGCKDFLEMYALQSSRGSRDSSSGLKKWQHCVQTSSESQPFLLLLLLLLLLLFLLDFDCFELVFDLLSDFEPFRGSDELEVNKMCKYLTQGSIRLEAFLSTLALDRFHLVHVFNDARRQGCACGGSTWSQ